MTKINNFVKAAVANVDKTKKQLATERVEEFLAEARTEVLVQLAQANANVTRAEAGVAKAANGLKKANSVFEIARYATPSSGDLEGYVLTRSNAELGIEAAEFEASKAKVVLNAAKDVVVGYVAVEADLA